jgi:DNA polymerase-3 subunit delta
VILHSLEELEIDLRKNGLRPVYLILGPEGYLCRSAVRLLKSKVLSPGAEALDYSEFAAEEVTADAIAEAANTYPMISGKRLVLVRDSEKLKDSEQDALLDLLKNISVRSTLILFAGDLDHRKRFYKTLRDGHCVAEFPKLKGPALDRWAEAFMRRQGCRISLDAIRKVVELAGSDLQSLASELEKLVLYAGKEKGISDDAVDALVRANRQQSIFELTDAMARGDRNGALRSLANLLEMGEEPLRIAAMIARHCRQVLIAKEYLLKGSDVREIGNAVQITSPYILDKFMRQVRAADSAGVRQIYMHVAEIDRRIKTSSGNDRMMLENLICSRI